ncbi:MAG: hypothetical protein Q9173_004688, partial [Seirophora scorigena]
MNNNSYTTTMLYHQRGSGNIQKKEHLLKPDLVQHAAPITSGLTLHLRGGRAPPTSTSIRPSLLETAVGKLQCGLRHKLTKQERRALRDSADLPPMDGVSDEEVRAMSAAVEEGAGAWWAEEEEEEAEAEATEEEIWRLPEGLSEWWAGMEDENEDEEEEEEEEEELRRWRERVRREWWQWFVGPPTDADGDERFEGM